MRSGQLTHTFGTKVTEFSLVPGSDAFVRNFSTSVGEFRHVFMLDSVTGRYHIQFFFEGIATISEKGTKCRFCRGKLRD